MATPLHIESVEETIYRILRKEIGSLRLAPEERLRLEELATRYGVSMTPIRQALRRLQGDGLVIGEARKGAYVAPLTTDELEEIQSLRVGIEGFLAFHGARNSTDESIAEMLEQRSILEDAYQRGDLEAYVSGFWAIRDACYRCANRPRLMRLVDDQRLRVERYILRLCADVESAAQLRDPPDLLVDACRLRDGAAAEASTRNALLWVLERLETMLGRPGDEPASIPPAA
jgi:DNA-binding GntR family transcriptional regulator